MKSAIEAHWMKVVGAMALALAIAAMTAIAGVVWIDHERVSKHETHIQGVKESSKDRYTGQQARRERERIDAVTIAQWQEILDVNKRVEFLRGVASAE